MALIKCKECGKEFSDKASQCIHCGCPIEKEEKKIFCVDCGNELKISDKVCSKCGCPTDNDNMQNNKNSLKVTTKNKEKNSSNIIRYIIGCICLLFVMSTKGVGILLVLLAVALILPITSKFIYEKVNIPKALKIIVPIVLIIASMVITPAFKNGYESTRNKGDITLSKNEEKAYNMVIKYSSTAYNPSELKVVSGNAMWGIKVSGTNKVGGTITKCLSFLPNDYGKETECESGSLYYDEKSDSEYYIDISKVNQKLKEYWNNKGM